MIQQCLAVACVGRPTQSFDAPAGLTALAPVVKNHCMFGGKRLDRIDPRPCARHAPFVDRRIEPARRAHQDRRSRAMSFIVRIYSVDIGIWHDFLRSSLMSPRTLFRRLFSESGYDSLKFLRIGGRYLYRSSGQSANLPARQW